MSVKDLALEILLEHRWVGYAYQCRCQVRDEPKGGLNADDTMDPEDWALHFFQMLDEAGLVVKLR